jgi:hypothetical protein
MVFYVGKGCGKRLYCGKSGGSNRGKHWKAIVAKAGGFDARKIVDNVDEEFAFLVEKERIDQLRKLGLELANKTDGGSGGITGYKHTDETKKKISNHHKQFYKDNPAPCLGKFGKDHPSYGYKHTEKARRGMSENCAMKRLEVVAKISGENNLKAKTILFDGKIFKTMIELAKYQGLSPNTIRTRICRYGAERYGYKILGNTRQLAKDFMQGQNLAPLNAAIEANS